MRKLLTLLIFTVSAITFGQDLTKTDIIGKWTTNDLVMDFGNAKPQDENILKELKKGFLNSEFDFRENGKFYIKFPNDEPLFMSELVFLNDKQWKLNSDETQIDETQIQVGTEEDNYSLMHILVQKASGKTYFIIPGMRLEMKKG